MVLEGAVFFLHWIWLFRTRKMRNKTKAADDGIEHSSKNHEEQDKTTLTECRLGSVNTSSSVLDKVEV